MTRKIGLYVQVTSDPDIRAKLQRVKPAVVLVHLDGGDLAGWIRQALPGTFVIGRYWWSLEQQESLLYTPGSALAQFMLQQKAARDCHAMMLFNEFLPSPYEAGYASMPGKPDKPPDKAWKAKADRYDALQVEFRAALKGEGMEAVAGNFGAGNWDQAAWYRDLQPLTWRDYRYIGHHVYGWPRLHKPDPWWISSLTATLGIMDAAPEKVHIITELGLTRKYADKSQPDVGWLSQPNPLTLDAYAGDLAAVHGELCQRGHVLGACLYNAAPEATWRTFAVTAELVARLEQMAECVQAQPPAVMPVRLQMPVRHANVLSAISQWWGENPANYNGWGHEGIDFALPTGTPVYAACAGVVHKTMLSPTYGKYVRLLSQGKLATADGGKTVTGAWETVYAHLSETLVKPGQAVQAGDLIGKVGSTGRSTGAHLHFGLRLPGQKSTDKFWGYSDPGDWLGLRRPVVVDRKRQLIAEIRVRLEELGELV